MQPLRPTIDEERRSLSMLVGMLLAGRAGNAGERELVQALGAAPIDFVTDLDTATLDLALSDPGAAATLTLRLSGTTSALGATRHRERRSQRPAARAVLADARRRGLRRLRSRHRSERAGARPRPRAQGRGRQARRRRSEGRRSPRARRRARRARLARADGLREPASTWTRRARRWRSRRPCRTARALADRRAATRAIAQAAPRLARPRDRRAGGSARRRDEGDRGGAGAAGRLRRVPWRSRASARSRCARRRCRRGKRAAQGHGALRDRRAPAGGGRERAAEGRAGGARREPMEIDVFIAPDGARCWIGAGGDPALVAAKLGAAAAGSGRRPGREARARLDEGRGRRGGRVLHGSRVARGRRRDRGVRGRGHGRASAPPPRCSRAARSCPIRA